MKILWNYSCVLTSIHDGTKQHFIVILQE